jgi:chaperonin GroES
MISPLNGNVLLKEIEEEEQLVGNIIVPDLGKEKAKLYEVVNTSVTYNYHTDKPIFSELVIGNKVFIPAFGGTKVSQNNIEYVMIKETEILGKYE